MSETEREQEASHSEGSKQSRASDQFGTGVSCTPPPLTHVFEKGAGSDHQVQGKGEMSGTDRLRPQGDLIVEPPTAESRLGRRLASEDGSVRPIKPLRQRFPFKSYL